MIVKVTRRQVFSSEKYTLDGPDSDLWMEECIEIKKKKKFTEGNQRENFDAEWSMESVESIEIMDFLKRKKKRALDIK